MASRKYSFLALALFVAAGVTACEPTGPTPEPTLPTCATGELQMPGDLSPNGEWVVLDPATYLYLSWTYSGPPCEPDFFEAYVWTGVEPESPGMTGRVNYDDAASPGSWSLPWPIPLQPGTTYYWRVYPGLETGPGPDVSGPSVLGHFFTGPECTDPEAMQPVDLLSPADDAQMAVTDDVTFSWDDPTACLVNGLFEIQISLTADFAEYLHRVPILQTVYTIPAADFPLEECTRYYWRVKTDPAGPLEEPFSETRSFFVHSPGVLCPVELPIIPEIPVVTPIPDLPFPPMAEALVDMNCRRGPSQVFRIDDTFFAGASAPIQGRNEDGTWLEILSPNLQVICWIWSARTEIQGDIGPLPVIVVPTPEPTPVDCALYTDSQSCWANPACRWEGFVSSAGGRCVNK